MNSLPIYLLVGQTLFLWTLVFVFYRAKNRLTLVPLYSLIAIMTLAMHTLSDLGFAISTGNFYLLISSVTFFTTLMLAILILYLFEGPRALRTALIVVVFVSLLYVLLVFLLGFEVNTSKWVMITPERLRYYLWSISAIILDLVFMSVAWEMLTKIRRIPLFLKVFMVVLGTYFLDTFIFVTGYFGSQITYWEILKSDLAVRLILALIATPIISFYIKTEGYREDIRKKPKTIWEIFNFRSDLESKIQTMEQILKYERTLEDKLEKAQETYRLALEGAGVGIWDWDIVKDIVTLSPQYSAMLGYGLEGLSPTKMAELRAMIHPDDKDKAVSLSKNWAPGNKTFSGEYRILTKSGKYKWFHNSGVYKFGNDGKPIRMVGSIIDIDENRHLLEETQHKSEELKKFQLAVEAATDQIVISDAEGIVLYANPVMEKITGYTREEALGKKAGSLWGKQMSLEYYKNLWDVIKNQKKSFIGEITNKRKNGIKYQAMVNISPILDDAGEVRFFVAIERDISKERQLEKMKDEFLNMASHELRTPMTAIKGFVSMILGGDYGKLDKNLEEPLTNIMMATNRLIDLVGDLLSVSRMQAGRLKIQLKNIEVNKIVKELVALLQPIAKDKEINLKVTSKSNIKVQADEVLLRQIINNLVGNALKFTENGGNVTLKLQKKGDLIIGEVKDTGVGIAREDVDKLFGRFQQISGPSGGKPVGTGLGLYISREITRLMGGDLWLVKTELGKGSTFAFSLPLAGTAEAKQVAERIKEEEKKKNEELSQEIKIS